MWATMDEELPISPSAPPDKILSDVDTTSLEPTAPEAEVAEINLPMDVLEEDGVVNQLASIRVEEPLVGAVGGEENHPPVVEEVVVQVKKAGKTSGRKKNESEFT